MSPMIATRWLTYTLCSLRRALPLSGSLRSLLPSSRLASAVALFAAIACRGSTEPLDLAGTCQRPTESGNYGCALLAGRVYKAVHEGQAGAIVTAAPIFELATGVVFMSDTVASDTAGRYQLYVLLKSPPVIQPPLDTVSVLVNVTLPLPDGSPAGTPTQSKDVAMILHLQPAGARLDTVEVFSVAF